MARRRNKRSRSRNPSRTQWIFIGLGTAAVITTGVVIYRRRRGTALPSGDDTGTPESSGAPHRGGTQGNWYRRHPGIVMRMCSQNGATSAADRTLLIDEVFVPAWRAAKQLLPATPTPTQISAMRDQIARNVMRQACTSPTDGAEQAARGLSNDAYRKVYGISGQ